MQKKLIALAVAGMAAAPVFAQSNVTIYGRADVGYVNRGSDDGAVQTNGRKTEMASGIGAGSRLGFRGAEDLGNGLKAIFELEYGLTMDSGPFNGSGTTGTVGGAPTSNISGITNRHTYVGLTGGFGTALAGRVDGARYGVWTKYDPFASGTVATGGNLQTHASRADNALVYITPDFSGFKVLGAYTTQLVGQEATNSAQTVTGVAPVGKANAGDERLGAIIAMYDNGPLSVSVDYEYAKPKKGTLASGLDVPTQAKTRLFVVGASYDFGILKLHGYGEGARSDEFGAAPVTGNGYIQPAGAKAWDQRSYMLGVTVPLLGDKANVKAAWTRLDDRTQTDVNGRQRTGDCNKYGIGASYFFSKRTSLNTDYARINNKNNGTCTIAFAASTGAFDGSGAGPAGGYGVSGFDLFIAHTF